MGIRDKIRRAILLLRRTRGSGLKFNPVDDRDFLYRPPRGEPPSEASVEKYVKIVDQGYIGTCAANALAGAIYVRERMSGLSYGYPSRLFLYWNARAQEAEPPLKDEGTTFRAACKALVRLGVPDEEDWPYRPRRVNDKPAGYGPWVRANPRKNGEYLAIVGSDRSKIKKIKWAIAQGHAVAFGAKIDRDFARFSGPDIVDRPRRRDCDGAHGMMIVRYRTRGGRTLYRVANSWGRRWRDKGLCWFTEEYITWAHCNDFTIVNGWERLQKK